MESMAPLMMGVTGAADLMNLAMESSAVVTAKAKVAAVGKAVADKAMAAGAKVAAAGQWLLNAAMSANPIGAVVILIVALVAGLILAYKKSETFREIVDGAMKLVKKAIDPVVNIIGDIVKGVKDATDKFPFFSDAVGVAKTLVVTYFDAITLPIRTVITLVGDLIAAIKKIDFPDIPDLNPLNKTSGRSNTGVPSKVPKNGGAPTEGPVVLYAPVIVNGYVGNEVQLARIVMPAIEAAVRRVTGPNR